MKASSDSCQSLKFMEDGRCIFKFTRWRSVVHYDYTRKGDEDERFFLYTGNKFYPSPWIIMEKGNEAN